ncbi:MAG TPA: polysaccharide biosynthesis protein [Terriglobales bacterium]|nr:polysaccharide biosynthesis protein [Terriglobales bacterium]
MAANNVAALPGFRFGGATRRLGVGARRYLPGILVELALITVILAGFQLSGYGRQPVWFNNVPLGLAFVCLAWGAAEARFRLYRRVWTVAGFPDAKAIGWAVIEATVLITLANAALPDSIRPFRYLAPPLAAPAIAAAIAIYRLWPRIRVVARRDTRRVLVVSPDGQAFPLVRWMVQHSPSGWEPVAILTASPDEFGKTVHGVPVAGSIDEIAHWKDVYQADAVAFVPRGPLEPRWKELVSWCLESDLSVLVVPEFGEVLHGRPQEASLRTLNADDLVGRARRDIELESARGAVSGQTVLVSGAAGSIGSELCRLLVRLEPRRLVLVDSNESGLFDVASELARLAPDVELREALVSIVELKPLQQVFTQEQPGIVFHAAAYKHVPMLEAHPEQAVQTNVLGTYNTLLCAERAGTRCFVLVSTDKAVSRQSIMGASKRLCEMLVLGFGGRMSSWAVRFGNVVGSRGSVVPIFERQISAGGPVTITHPDCTRYMMTIREAASLVISTLSVGRPSRLYMLDMGEPISIDRLARSLIRSRGLRPDTDIQVVYTALRAGESLHEELLADDEAWRPTSEPAVREVVSPAPLRRAELARLLHLMGETLDAGSRDELVDLLRKAVTTGDAGRAGGNGRAVAGPAERVDLTARDQPAPGRNSPVS